MTPEFLLAFEGDLALRVPAVGELALVLLDPLRGYVVGGVGGTRREVHEERLVGQQCLLLARPVDRLVGEVLGQVIALRGRLRGLDRRGALVQGGVPLVVLPADEAVEVLETATARGPCGEGACRTGLPHRNLVALAELRRRVAVQLERLRQRRLGVRQHGAVSRCCGGDLGDAAHSHRVMVAAGEQRLAGRRAQRRGVEPGVLQSARGELLEVGRVARAAEGAGGAVADVVDEDDHARSARPRVGERP